MATVFSTHDNIPSREAQLDDIVYRVDGNGQYKHTAHRVQRIVNGKAITKCGVWLGFGAVESNDSDYMVWCTFGCKPTTPQETSK